MKGLGKWCGLMLLAAMPARADEALQKIFDCMHANLPPTLRVQHIELENTDRSGSTRILKGRLYAMREKSAGSEGLIRAMLHIDVPDYLAGAAWLVREGKPGADDEMYVFLPSVNRVRRVIGDAGYDSMLGTNFSYVDFKQLENGFGGVPAATLEAPQQIEQRPVHVISFKAQAGTAAGASGYSAIRTWIDQKTCMTLKADFYDGSAVRKEFTAPAAALRQSGVYWYLSQGQMRDLRDGTNTLLRILDVSSSEELPTRLFDPRLFYLGK
ncbi:MAG: outer membrane lipoprotein-sorting protein [Nevskiales bacterium]